MRVRRFLVGHTLIGASPATIKIGSGLLKWIPQDIFALNHVVSCRNPALQCPGVFGTPAGPGGPVRRRYQWDRSSHIEGIRKVYLSPACVLCRSQEAADRIIAECTALNPEGEYIFIPADVSLIRVVDEVCAKIRAQETHLNILFLSAGVPSFDRIETSEQLHLLAALLYYSRLRFITRLLPLIKQAPSLRRVVTVAGGGIEGPLDVTDFPALRVPLELLRGHLSTLITLGVEAVARSASEVSFIHDYPGPVDTPLAQRMLAGRETDKVDLMSAEESGERHMYLVTSARYPPLQRVDSSPPPQGIVDVVCGTNGELGSGVYSVGVDGESASRETLEFLAGLREEGGVDQVWKHTEGEFMRVTGD